MRSRSFRRTLCAAGFALLFCLSLPAQDKKGADKGGGPAVAPAAPGVDAAVDPNSYLIGVTDVLNILIWREPELSGTFAVRPDGRITLRLVGDVTVEGLTPRQAAARVTEAYSKLLNRPEVTVSVQQVLSKKFSCTGKVNRVGAVPLVAPTTVLEGILACGGLAEFAKQTKIHVLRKTVKLPFNYKEVVKGKRTEQNVLLQNGDLIVVP